MLSLTSGWKIGARFVCPKCWTRWSDAVCPACATLCLDVGTPEGWLVLNGRWRSYGAFARGRALYSPFAAHRLPVVLWLSILLAVAGMGASVVGAFARNRTAAPDLIVAVMVGVVCAPFVAMFFGAFLVLYAYVCRWLAVLVGVFPTPLGFGRAKVNLVAAIFDFISTQLLLPIVSVERPLQPVKAVSGTLAEPLTVHLRDDSNGFVERHDAWLDGPVKLTVAGELRSVELTCGEIAFTFGLGSRSADLSAPPPWAEVPGRPGRGRIAIFPIATQFVLKGQRLELRA